MFPAAFLSSSRNVTVHFLFQCSVRTPLIAILLHSADVYTLVITWVGYMRPNETTLTVW